MKILFVCQQYIHAARWINQLKDSEHEVFVFDCLDKKIHDDLRWTNFTENWSKRKVSYIKGEYWIEKNIPSFFKKIEPILKVTASEKLEEIIKEIKPDLVHSLEMQSQTYPLLKVRQKLDFKWAYFSWGSDIYLYQNKKYHKKVMQKIFAHLNCLFVDNNRDVLLAKTLGFRNEVSGVFPGGGGYDLGQYKKYVKPISQRNLILVKGYHHWAGKALCVLNALELIIDTVKNYSIYIYSAHDVVISKIEALNAAYNLNIEYSSRKHQITHTDLLQKFGKAKIAIGNSISDGIPNTLLEAIILGAFPIQSNPGHATEDYIKDKENGFLIHDPENIEHIAKLIEEALTNEHLLIGAYQKNQNIALRLDEAVIRKKVLDAYKKIEHA
ncbi:MAG: glycosyltransferase [Flavobacteriaceae bacterium]|nr:glycosyltransferase [Flavobacteriaceae bacterium]